MGCTFSPSVVFGGGGISGSIFWEGAVFRRWHENLARGSEETARVRDILRPPKRLEMGWL
jgi:hypothetical protein